MPHDRFAAELNAVADSLRHITEQVRLMVQVDDPRLGDDSTAFTITAYGREVALDAVAQRLEDAAKDGQ